MSNDAIDTPSAESQTTSLRLYDTATHSVTPFTPLTPGEVRIYVCGATVQSSPHVGHLRAAVAFDVVRRWFLKLGYKVVFVRNVTDIDDKILAKAAAAGEEWWARAYRYEREFTQAYDLLGVLPPTYEPRATGHMTDMIDLVQRLLDRGHAYVIPNADGTPSGNVYFDVPSWPEYGALTHQETGTLAAADSNDADAAVADRMGPSVDAAGSDKYNTVDAADESADKHNPRDFALWKAAKSTEPATASWPAPFGKGRPGWHLECSAMSHRYLGADFDIHGGGLDLRFPHHENEMAQSRAAGWGFAHRWMHSAWVTQSGEKMSKSLGNGLSVGAVLADHSAWVIRYALASVHYRSMLEWSDQTLSEAESAFERISRFVAAAGTALGTQPGADEVQGVPADALPADFVAAMDDDINVSNALAAVFSTIRHGNSLIAEGASADTIASALLQVRSMLDVFGLDPLNSQWASATNAADGEDSATAHALDALVSEQLAARAQARKDKDFARADAIRDALTKAGIEIEDGASGSTWHV
ncbi:MAG: cysteine--tRNA ligase [Bifidobacteriaceae bacterium]|jgi:cysteinyl-tRNA synthetase|nr:cysteine--tRNA ligase [Bifidobacteriaceae bacterium]